MLFVGNQRGGGKNLAQHLVKDENDHVELHEVRGFVGQDLVSAFKEAYAVSQATKCKKYLYSLSINPPPNERVSKKDFENAINRVEQKLGLSGQPRVIVFHEKEGRRHAHAVWSRISVSEMKAVQLSHDHPKLMDISRDLFVEHGWKMPRGMLSSGERDPLNFSLAEWQQAKRAGKDARVVKSTIKDCWAVSDSQKSFASALTERGYILARGRRGHVAVDFQGEAFAISRATDLKAHKVRQRLGEIDTLPSVPEAHGIAAKLVADRLKAIQKEEERRQAAKEQQLARERVCVQQRHNAETSHLLQAQKHRQQQERAARRARLRKGMLGFWDRLTGKRKITLEQNKREARQSMQRDIREKQAIIAQQQISLEVLQHKVEAARQKHSAVHSGLNSDVKQVHRAAVEHQDAEREAFKSKRRRTPERPRQLSKSKPKAGPSLDR